MKHLYLTLFTLALSVNCLSQNSDQFEVISIGSQYNSEKVMNAMKSADWCGFFFKNERHKLTFDDGTIVELKSENELLNDGISVDESCYSDYYSDERTYKVHESGKVLIQLTSSGSVKSQF